MAVSLGLLERTTDFYNGGPVNLYVDRKSGLTYIMTKTLGQLLRLSDPEFHVNRLWSECHHVGAMKPDQLIWRDEDRAIACTLECAAGIVGNHAIANAIPVYDWLRKLILSQYR